MDNDNKYEEDETDKFIMDKIVRPRTDNPPESSEVTTTENNNIVIINVVTRKRDDVSQASAPPAAVDLHQTSNAAPAVTTVSNEITTLLRVVARESTTSKQVSQHTKTKPSAKDQLEKKTMRTMAVTMAYCTAFTQGTAFTRRHRRLSG